MAERAHGGLGGDVELARDLTQGLGDGADDEVVLVAVLAAREQRGGGAAWPRGAVPASASQLTTSPSRRTSRWGVAATSAAAPGGRTSTRVHSGCAASSAASISGTRASPASATTHARAATIFAHAPSPIAVVIAATWVRHAAMSPRSIADSAGCGAAGRARHASSKRASSSRHRAVCVASSRSTASASIAVGDFGTWTYVHRGSANHASPNPVHGGCSAAPGANAAPPMNRGRLASSAATAVAAPLITAVSSSTARACATTSVQRVVLRPRSSRATPMPPITSSPVDHATAACSGHATTIEAAATTGAGSAMMVSPGPPRRAIASPASSSAAASTSCSASRATAGITQPPQASRRRACTRRTPAGPWR